MTRGPERGGQLGLAEVKTGARPLAARRPPCVALAVGIGAHE